MSQTGVRTSALVLRVTLGACFVAHGWPKVIGLFGDHGAGSWVNSVRSLGLEPVLPFAAAIALGELFAGLAMLIGVFTRVAGALIIAIMIGAIWTVTGRNGYSAPGSSGFEYNLALMAMALSVFLTGPGAYAFKIQKAD